MWAGVDPLGYDLEGTVENLKEQTTKKKTAYLYTCTGQFYHFSLSNHPICILALASSIISVFQTSLSIHLQHTYTGQFHHFSLTNQPIYILTIYLHWPVPSFQSFKPAYILTIYLHWPVPSPQSFKPAYLYTCTGQFYNLGKGKTDKGLVIEYH